MNKSGIENRFKSGKYPTKKVDRSDSGWTFFGTAEGLPTEGREKRYLFLFSRTSVKFCFPKLSVSLLIVSQIKS